MITQTHIAISIGQAIEKARIEILCEPDDEGNDTFTAIAEAHTDSITYPADVKLVFDIEDDNFFLDHAEVDNWDSRFDSNADDFDDEDITAAIFYRLKKEWQEYKEVILQR